MKEGFKSEAIPSDPHGFIPLVVQDLTPTELVLDPQRPRTVYRDPSSGEQFVRIAEKNHLGQNNYPLGQAVISLCCKGVLNVSEALPVRTPDGNTIIASRIIDLEKTQAIGDGFMKSIESERWILQNLFGDYDHKAYSNHNLKTTQDGRYAWFDFGQGSDNFFFLSPEINHRGIELTVTNGIASLVQDKLERLEKQISDPRFVESIFQKILKEFPDKKMEDMFYDSKRMVPKDFQQLLLSCTRSALRHLKALAK